MKTMLNKIDFAHVVLTILLICSFWTGLQNQFMKDDLLERLVEVGDEIDQLKAENEQLSNKLKENIPATYEQECFQKEVIKTEIKFVDRVVVKTKLVPVKSECTSVVRDVEKTRVVTVKQPHKKNLVGVNVGVSKSGYESSVAENIVTIKKSQETVLSADYTFMLNDSWGVSGQIQTNETYLIGAKYAF